MFRGVALTLLLAAGLACGGERERPAPPSNPPPDRVTELPEAASEPEPQLVLVRRRTGLPPAWIRRLRRSDAVEAMARASRTQWLLTDGARAGYAFPLDVNVVDPRAYARVTGERAFRRLNGRSVLLSASSADHRGLGEGDRMRLTGGRTVTVAGIIGEDVARDAEVVAATAAVPPSERRQTSVVVRTADPAAIDDAVPDDPLTRVAVLDPQPDPRGRGIIRPLAVKRRFGEFAVRLPYGDDWFTPDPGWVRETIVSRSVPILGSVTCHRALIGPLRRALGTLRRRGLSGLVDPGDYAGCYAPRRIPASGSLSLHAWGLAVDINASENPQGSKPRLDRRIVKAFEDEGFTWGGRWPTAPDGMHFELHGD